MKSLLKLSALGAILCIPADVACAAVTMQIVSDNDFAVFVGGSTQVSRLVYQNDVSWPSQLNNLASFDFDFEPGETWIYLLAMGAGGAENIGGSMNGVDLTTIDVSQSSNLSGALTGYSSSYSDLDNGTFSAALDDVSAAMPGLSWGGVTVTEEGVGTIPTGTAFDYPAFSAVIYRFSAASIGVTVPAIPEPSVALLGLAVGVVVISRRQRRRN